MPTLTLILDDDVYQALADAARISIKGPPEQLASEVLLAWLEEFWGNVASEYGEDDAGPGRFDEGGGGQVGGDTLDPNGASRGILAPNSGKAPEDHEKPSPPPVEVKIPGLLSFPAKGWACEITRLLPPDAGRKGIWQYEHERLERGSTVELPVGSLVLLADATSESKMGLAVRLTRVYSDGGLGVLAKAKGPAWAIAIRGAVEQALGDK